MLLLALILVVGASLLGGWAQHAVKRRFAEQERVPNQAGLSGAEVARVILRQGGLREIPVEKVEGSLSDHYDPRAMVLRLSEPVYDGRSVAALGVAAHECGHALQQLHRFTPLNLRSLTVPTARLGNYLGLPLILL
ncbi:MAG: zinc metallopeptidase, partial [Planctomycetota bacterium]